MADKISSRKRFNTGTFEYLYVSCRFCKRCIYSPFIPCDFALPPHRRGSADCSVLPVFFNKPGTVDSSLTQTRVWSDCQHAKAHSLQHTPHQNSPCSVCITAPPQFTPGSQSHSAALNLNLAHLQSLPHSPFPLPHPHSPPNLITPPPPSLQLHSGLHDNTLWREPLSPRAAQTVSIFTPS